MPAFCIQMVHHGGEGLSWSYIFPLFQTLKRIVKERMQEYQEAALKDNNIDKQLSPLLEKLQRENDELRKQGLHLRTQLEQKEKEKQTLKVWHLLFVPVNCVFRTIPSVSI